MRRCTRRTGLALLLLLAGACVPSAEPPEQPTATEPGSEQPPPDRLPDTRELEVTVEGQTEHRAATLFESPQGYAIYVLPQIVMTPEEPGQDQAFARVDDGFFIRIQRLPREVDAADQRAKATLALQSIGAVHELQGEDIFHAFFRDAEFFLHASSADVSVNRLLIEIDGGLYAITMHLPHREAAEGITPSFWAMLGSIRTLRPYSDP